MVMESPIIKREDYDGCQIALMELQAGNEGSEWVDAAKHIWGEDTKVWEAVVGAWECCAKDAAEQFGTDPADIVCVQIGQDENDNPRYRFLTVQDMAKGLMGMLFPEGTED
jgi:hypothetical protein